MDGRKGDDSNKFVVLQEKKEKSKAVDWKEEKRLRVSEIVCSGLRLSECGGGDKELLNREEEFPARHGIPAKAWSTVWYIQSWWLVESENETLGDERHLVL